MRLQKGKANKETAFQLDLQEFSKYSIGKEFKGIASENEGPLSQ